MDKAKKRESDVKKENEKRMARALRDEAKKGKKKKAKVDFIFVKP